MRKNKENSIESGRIVGENGKIYNKVDLYQNMGSTAQPIESVAANITQFVPRKGRLVSESGEVYNEAELLKSIPKSYSKTESDNRYVPNSGNTKPGSMSIVRDSLHLRGQELTEVVGSEINIQAVSSNSEEPAAATVTAGSAGGVIVNEDEGISIHGLPGTDTVLRVETAGKGVYYLKPGETKAAGKEIARKEDIQSSTMDYAELVNKPSINNVALSGNKTLSDLGIGEHDNYTETILWQNPDETSNPETITLSEDMSTFDAIMFIVRGNGSATDEGYYIPFTYRVKDLPDVSSDKAAFEYVCDLFNQTHSVGYSRTSNTVLTRVDNNGGFFTAAKFIGIRYGARKPYKETVLWRNTTAASGANIPFTLTERADRFNAITLCLAFTGSAAGTYKFITIPNDMIGAGISENYGTDHWFGASFDNPPISGNFTSVGQWTLSKIIGISYGGSVKGRNVTELYSANAFAASFELSDTVDNYDELIVYRNLDSTAKAFESSVTTGLISAYPYTFGALVGTAGDDVLTIAADKKTVSYSKNGNIFIDTIYGIKYNSDYITVDKEMSSTSENPVQNKVIKAYIDAYVNAKIAEITDNDSET